MEAFVDNVAKSERKRIAAVKAGWAASKRAAAARTLNARARRR